LTLTFPIERLQTFFVTFLGILTFFFKFQNVFLHLWFWFTHRRMNYLRTCWERVASASACWTVCGDCKLQRLTSRLAAGAVPCWLDTRLPNNSLHSCN